MGHNAPIHMPLPDPDVTFEFNCPPPEPQYKAADAFVPLRLEAGSKEALSKVEKPAANQGNAEHNQIAVKPHVLETLPEAPVQVSHLNLPQPPAANVVEQESASNAVHLLQPASATTTAGGGANDGANGATGNGGSAMGAGTGDQNSLLGGDFGIKQAMALRAPAAAMGNIKPYKMDMIARVKRSWSTTEQFDGVRIDVTLNHDGKLVAKELVAGTGNSTLDQQLLDAVDNTEFAPLPGWFHGSQLTFKLILSSS